MSKLLPAAAALLILSFTVAQAGVRNIQAGDEAALIKAFEDANADTSEMMVIHVKGTGTFEFTHNYQDSGYALPPLQSARVSILVEQPGVTFFFNPPSAAKSTGEPVQMGGIKLEDGAAMFVGAFFLDINAYLAGKFPNTESVKDLPTFDHGPFADGPVFESIDSILIFNMIRVLANLQAAILATNSRFIGVSSYFGSEGLDLEIPTGQSPPNNADVESIVPELAGLVAIAKSAPGSKSVDAAALETLGKRLSELARKGDAVLETSIINTAFNAVGMSGIGTLHVQNSMIKRFGFSPAVSIFGVPGSTKVILENSVIDHPDFGAAIIVARADLRLDGVTIDAEDVLKIQDDASVAIFRSILGVPGTSDRDPACEFDHFSAELTSLGYNVSPDSSCGLNKPTDRQGMDPRITAPATGELLPGLANNSPAIDGGPSKLTNGVLPCGTNDLTGMARPQDGDGDGKAECDVGALEKASRAGIDGRQSGAYYDLSRNGEGVFVEMLSPTTALVYFFSYTPAGEPFWALGVGTIAGNGIVIRKQDFLTTRGAMFGPDFDPADVEFIPFADMSLNFPDCRNTAKKGSLVIAPNDDLGFGPVLSSTQRLTFILDCGSRAQMGPGYSGSFFDPSHDGEGIILQVIDGTTVVVQWFTYDDQGNQYWIQGVGTLSDGKITVEEALAFRGPRYGPGYDAGDLDPVTWGSIMIEFDGCDAARLTYESVIAGFGSGMQNLQRLTSLRGVGCP